MSLPASEAFGAVLGRGPGGAAVYFLHSGSADPQRHPDWQSFRGYLDGEFHTTGHVAIVTEVFADRIRVPEQDESDRKWSTARDYSRELPERIDQAGGYWTEPPCNGARILGWMCCRPATPPMRRAAVLPSRILLFPYAEVCPP